MNELLSYVPKDISSIIEDYYHPYKIMFDEVIKEIEQNTKRKETHQYALDKISEMYKNQIYDNEHRIYFLKKRTIDDFKETKK